ncbi:MAG TPA: hypothetical protein VGN94_08550, partial [Methylobacterium sp.]|nr:hypothetical protein [Methylobacterium sp.]
MSKTEAVRMALVNALERRERARPLAERLQPHLARIASVPTSAKPVAATANHARSPTTKPATKAGMPPVPRDSTRATSAA